MQILKDENEALKSIFVLILVLVETTTKTRSEDREMYQRMIDETRLLFQRDHIDNDSINEEISDIEEDI